MCFKISVLFNNHIKGKITRTVFLSVRLRNMKINAMKLLFHQIIFLKTFREYFNICPRVMETGCLRRCPTSLWLLRVLHVLGSRRHATNPTKRASSGGACMFVCVFKGWEEKDRAQQRRVSQSLEHHTIDHSYCFQLWQDPKPRKFLLESCDMQHNWKNKLKKALLVKDSRAVKHVHSKYFLIKNLEKEIVPKKVVRSWTIYFPSLSSSLIFTMFCSVCLIYCPIWTIK